MPESKEAYDRLDDLTSSVDDLRRQVSAIVRSKQYTQEVLDELLESDGSLARVFLLVDSAMTQSQIAAAFESRWGRTISAGGLSQKLTRLGEMDLVLPASARLGRQKMYSPTSLSKTMGLVRRVESDLRKRDRK